MSTLQSTDKSNEHHVESWSSLKASPRPLLVILRVHTRSPSRS